MQIPSPGTISVANVVNWKDKAAVKDFLESAGLPEFTMADLIDYMYVSGAGNKSYSKLNAAVTKILMKKREEATEFHKKSPTLLARAQDKIIFGPLESREQLDKIISDFETEVDGLIKGMGAPARNPSDAGLAAYVSSYDMPASLSYATPRY